MHGKDRGDDTENKQYKNRFVKRGSCPLPFPVPALLKQKGGQGN